MTDRKMAPVSELRILHPGAWLWLRMDRFARREDGGMLFFALVILLIMLFVGGMAVDLMRYEAERSRIQAAADASALAAASMRQERPPVDVVEDWFAAANLSDALTGVTVDEGLNFRSVRAETRTVTRPYFMHMLGVNELRSVAAGRAEERRTNVEISLVLDISGSMRWNNKAINLRNAAKEFIENTLRDDSENRVSISLVPYNGSVMLDANLMSRFNVAYPHSMPTAAAPSRCLDLPTSTYSSIPISRNQPYPQSGFFDSFSWAWDQNYYAGTVPDYFQQPLGIPSNADLGNYYNVTCTPRTQNVVRVFSNNRTGLKNIVDNLSFVGATSIDLGLKWGAALLDPASRPMVSELVSLGAVSGNFDGRPFDYDDDENLKVIVLMTDGEHFAHEKLNDAYRSNVNSGIYRSWDSSANVWRYSIYHANAPTSKRYWVPHLNNGNGEWRSSAFNTGSGVTQLKWLEVWSNLRVKWVAWQLYARAFDTNATTRQQIYTTWMNNFRTVTPTTEMDTRLLSLCQQIKNNNVLIFGIAFEAPEHGTNVIRQCATQDRFYDVEGLEISTAFRNIRATISNLRLTQ